MREARSEKILVLGIDGMDPSMTKKYIEEGKMPNTKKFMEYGAQREDLVLLGSQPTVTPPMWTSLACGCNPNVHGITCFSRHSDKGLDFKEYNLDSTNCHAEPLWNVFAEAGKKHWFGIGLVPAGRPPVTARICMSLMAHSRQGSIWPLLPSIQNVF